MPDPVITNIERLIAERDSLAGQIAQNIDLFARGAAGRNMMFMMRQSVEQGLDEKYADANRFLTEGLLARLESAIRRADFMGWRSDLWEAGGDDWQKWEDVDNALGQEVLFPERPLFLVPEDPTAANDWWEPITFYDRRTKQPAFDGAAPSLHLHETPYILLFQTSMKYKEKHPKPGSIGERVDGAPLVYVVVFHRIDVPVASLMGPSRLAQLSQKERQVAEVERVKWLLYGDTIAGGNLLTEVNPDPQEGETTGAGWQTPTAARVMARLSFAAEPFVEVREEGLKKNRTTLGGKKVIHESSIQRVLLRKAPGQGTRKEEVNPEWKHCWFVRSHMRINYRTGTKTISVPGYLKGNPELPLMADRTTVSIVRR